MSWVLWMCRLWAIKQNYYHLQTLSENSTRLLAIILYHKIWDVTCKHLFLLSSVSNSLKKEKVWKKDQYRVFQKVQLNQYLWHQSRKLCFSFLLFSIPDVHKKLRWLQNENIEDGVRGLVKIKKRHFWEFFPTWGGGGCPNPKTFVILPSHFWHAKFILRC